MISRNCQSLIGSEFDTIKYRVIQILKEDPVARNSDKVLLENYYLSFEGKKILLTTVATTPETILRARRKIQNQNPSLRADPKVDERRQEKKEDFREFFSQNKGAYV